MKLNYIKPISLACMAMVLAGCSENSWNKTFLDGYTGDVSYDEAVTIEYTLTTSDYEAIGNALYQLATTQDEKDAANSIRNNHFFDEQSAYPATVAVPQLLNKTQTQFYALNPGSAVNVSLRTANPTADQIAISNAAHLVLENTTSASSIPNILKTELPDAENGDYAIVSYGGASTASAASAAPAQQVPLRYTRTVPSRATTVWTVAEALAQMEDGFEGEAIVKGYVVYIQEISTSFGNATYWIADDPDDTKEDGLEVYRGYGLNGDKFTSEDELNIGDFVYVSGKLVNYNGNTFEFTSGNKIIDPSTLDDGGDNPGGDNPGGDNPGSDELTANITNLAVDDVLTATAVVTALDSRGMILTDNAGSILYYMASGFNPSDYPIGTVVEVSGAVSAYNKGLQLGSDKTTITKVGSMDYSYPTPTDYNAAMVDQAVEATTDFLATYVSITGELSVNNTYYNIIIDGASAQGSVYYATDEVKAMMTSGNTYTFYGYFMAVSGSGTKYFNMVVTSVKEIVPEVDQTKLVNAIYKFSQANNAWEVPENAVVVNPEYYTQYGFKNNQLSDPDIYLPLILKEMLPYQKPNTELYVAYNLATEGCSCDLVSYNGGYWSVPNDYVENKVGQYLKGTDEYTFFKWIGEEVYDLYTGSSIGLDCGYLIVYGGVCMEPVPESKSYGYPAETPVTISDGKIVMPNSNNEFRFVTSTIYNGNTYTTPEGYFLILDANNRYMYLQGTYSSFNLRKGNAYIENDGTINPQYLFTAEKNADDTWSIVNTQGDLVRTLYYSDGNNDFAAYDETALQKYVGVLPFLYINQTSNPNATGGGSDE